MSHYQQIKRVEFKIPHRCEELTIRIVLELEDDGRVYLRSGVVNRGRDMHPNYPANVPADDRRSLELLRDALLELAAAVPLRGFERCPDCWCAECGRPREGHCASCDGQRWIPKGYVPGAPIPVKGQEEAELELARALADEVLTCYERDEPIARDTARNLAEFVIGLEGRA
ncbi:MAG: hypothetical protein KKA81_16895 [Bacteroidetes bacterium]|nr:hypothetical protein [Bacteroidota bacterium]